MSVAMAKRRPKAKPAPDPQPADDGDGSDTVRVASDLKRMVKVICGVEDVKAAVLMDELLRDRLTARFEPYREWAEEKEQRAAEEAARLAELRKHLHKEPE